MKNEKLERCFGQFLPKTLQEQTVIASRSETEAKQSHNHRLGKGIRHRRGQA